jgi:hypothetical protein
MDTQKLIEVRASLDALPGDTTGCTTGQNCYDIVEERAIAILDSQFMDFPDGMLQEYLMSYLYLRQIEYDLIKFPAPEEE